MSTTSPTIQEQWRAVIAAAYRHFPKPTVDLWFHPFHPTGVEENRLILEAHPSLVYWTGRRYGKRLGDLVREHTEFSGAVLREARPEGEAA